MAKPFKKLTRHRFEEEVAQELGINLSRSDRIFARTPVRNRQLSEEEPPVGEPMADDDDQN